MNSYCSVIIWIHTSTPSYEFKSCVWIHIFKSIPATPLITHTESSIGHSPSVLVHYDNLPYGCGNKFYPRGRALCIDHNTKCTALERPLPPIEDHCKHNDPCDNRIVASVNNLLRLTSDLNSWTSKFVITHGDQSIDVWIWIHMMEWMYEFIWWQNNMNSYHWRRIWIHIIEWVYEFIDLTKIRIHMLAVGYEFI